MKSEMALVTVVAIMTFLASLTAGAAMLISDASRGWQEVTAREMTIQIRPTAGRDLDADSAKAVELARAMPGVASVRAYTKAQSEELLQPWLGSGLARTSRPKAGGDKGGQRFKSWPTRVPA